VAVSDPQDRPRDGDRKRAVSKVDAAYSDGRITAADRALRVGNIESAATIGELDLVVRDLVPAPPEPQAMRPPPAQPPPAQPPPAQPPPAQPPVQFQLPVQFQQVRMPPPIASAQPGAAQPGSGQPGAAQGAPPPPWTVSQETFRVAAQRRRSPAFLIAMIVVIAVIAMVGVAGSFLVSLGSKTIDALDTVPSVDPITPLLPPESPTVEPLPDRLAFTVAGLRWFVGRYKAEFATTRAVRVTIWTDRASVDLPVHGGRRQKSWSYSKGEFVSYGSATATSRGSAIVDLRDLRLKPLVANIARAKRTLGVEKPETIYVILGHDTFDAGPEAHIYVTNRYNESGYLATTFGGRVVRSYPYQR
jgi:hypothetical protein